MNERFHDFTYQRPDFPAFQAEFRTLIRDFEKASEEGQHEILQSIHELRNRFSSLSSLAHIRYTLNTKDSFYEKEQEFFDEIEPLYEELVTDYYRVLVHSPHKSRLAGRWGQQLFSIAEMRLKTFTPAVIGELQQENKLGSRYKKLLASAAIMFDGEERNLSQLTPYQQSPDRAVRRAAAEARYRFFSDHLEQFDELFDELVRVRTKIARRLGFSDFTALGYLRMNRSDYNTGQVESFRSQIERYIVPLAAKIRSAQESRLGLDHLKYYDESLFFPEGNPLPEGTPEEIIECGRRMYAEMSEQTGTFFAEMTGRELMDLLSRKGKAPGGYCDFLPLFEAPFIFANFNGTSGDIDVLTHEAGHAFQLWLAKNTLSSGWYVPEYQFATMDAAEIPSMGIEFFCWPWMEYFFGERAGYYRYQHLSEALLFLPYGSLVDHFQHEVYAQPDLKPHERRNIWRHLEKRYLPHRNYDHHSFLEEGGYWFQQGHIFEVPFYYIDYVLAQTCVFQLWQCMQKNREEAWQNYLSLCRAGGSLPFTGLLPLADITSPFASGTVETAAQGVRNWLEEEKNRP